MFEKAKPARDAFTFSLGGMTTIASFVAAPAIADDRINKILDDRLKQGRRSRDWQACFGAYYRPHFAHGFCA